jgi:protoporphyrin/coproporphyrin ferrochelatase
MSTGVLLMTFGAVESLDDVPRYYTNIRGGKAPTEAEVADLRARYELIGGRSPLADITRRQAAALSLWLTRIGDSMPVEVGMRYWTPTIENGVRRLAEKGVRRIIGITSGPYDSGISVASYERFFDAARNTVDQALEISLIRKWFDAPGLDAAWKTQYDAALKATGWEAGSFHTLLTSHALPERVLPLGDPYPVQFQEHAARLASFLGLKDWGTCYQSAGLTHEPWLGPDILPALQHLKAAGRRRVLVMPIGFCADHLEILHDLDIEAAARANQLGLEFARAPSLNDSPRLAEAWSAALMGHVQEDGR